MRISFWGVRGSYPVPGPNTVRYGGHTSCVEARCEGGGCLIVDAGTGLRALGHQLAEAQGARPWQYHIALSHVHWDHIQGLPFFTPVFRPDAVIDIHGPRQDEGPLLDVFTGVMRPPYFPITPAQLGGTVTFLDTDNDDFAVNGAKVRARWVRHTDPTLGYRVELEGSSVTYISDHGPGCVPDDADDYIPDAVLELCDGVDVLIHDAQHTTHEYETKRHFGHSTIDYAVHVAREAGTKTLVLFHHCPSHGDAAVDEILDYARDLSAETNGPEVVAAHEGMRLDLSRP